MADLRLLRIIDELANDLGMAGEKKVEAAYGPGFRKALREAFDDGLLTTQGASIGTVKLSASGRRLARGS